MLFELFFIKIIFKNIKKTFTKEWWHFLLTKRKILPKTIHPDVIIAWLAKTVTQKGTTFSVWVHLVILVISILENSRFFSLCVPPLFVICEITSRIHKNQKCFQIVMIKCTDVPLVYLLNNWWSLFYNA